MGMKTEGCQGTVQGKVNTFVFQFACLLLTPSERRGQRCVEGVPALTRGPLPTPSAQCEGRSQVPGLILPRPHHVL